MITPLYVTIDAPALSAFTALESTVRATATTFRGSYTTAAQRDRAIDALVEIEAAARTARILLRGAKAAERKGAA